MKRIEDTSPLDEAPRSTYVPTDILLYVLESAEMEDPPYHGIPTIWCIRWL